MLDKIPANFRALSSPQHPCVMLKAAALASQGLRLAIHDNAQFITPHEPIFVVGINQIR